MNNEFITKILFSNVEDNEEKENFLKELDYVHNQSVKGEEIDNKEIDKILGLTGLNAVEKLGKISELITVALNIRDEYSLIKETLKTEHIKIPEERSEAEENHIMFCCKEENREHMLENDDLFVETYLKFDQVSGDNISVTANKKSLILLMLSSLIHCIYENSTNDNESIIYAYDNYINNRSRSKVTSVLYSLLLIYMDTYHIKSISDLKNDVLGDLVNFEISMIFPRLKKCNFESIVEIINNLCYHYNTNDNITKSNIDKEIKKTIKEMIGYDIKLGEHRLEDIYISCLNEESSMADLIINIVIEIIVEDIMENSSESNFGSNKYRKDMINYTTNRYYDYSENSNIILVIYCTIMDFLVNNRNPYTYELFKEALLTLLKEKFIRQ